jgi:hypothetical protein
VPPREYVEITEMFSGMVFRFYTDLAEPHRLHVSARWGVEPEMAIRVFFDDSAERLWIPDKQCYETHSTTHVLVWLELAPRQILVITCVPREASQHPLPGTEGEPA